MRSRLNRITDWENIAEASNYSAGEMARRCGVSARQLERFFLESKCKTPSDWLTEIRQRRALELMKNGQTIKEIAGALGFKQMTNFSREFKRHHGMLPSEYRATE